LDNQGNGFSFRSDNLINFQHEEHYTTALYPERPKAI